MRKIKFVILLTFVGFLFITSCKKDKSTNSETEEPIPLVLDSNTVVLNLNNVSSIIEAHENYMIVSNLSIGNGRIASGHGSIELKQNSHFACEPNDKYPKGAFKKVESIEPYGQGTNYTQINFYAYSLNDPIPQITEAVISGSAKETKAVTNEISSVYDNLGNLIPITFDGGKLKLELTKTIDLDDDLRTTDDQFKLTGTFKSNIDLEFDMRLKNKEIEKLKLGCKITPELDVKVSKSMKKPLYQVKKKINLYNIYLNPIVVPMGVPPIVFPVVFNPVIAINAEVSATGDVKIEGTVLEYKSSFGAGFEYSKSNGYKDYKSANFPPISLNPSLILDFEGQLKAKIEPELSYRLYDQPDISVSTGLGAYAKLKLTASAGTPPPNFDLNLESYMGIEGKLGAKLKLFKKSIVDWEFSYTIAEVKILDVKKFVTNWNSNPVDLSNGLVAYYPFNGNPNDESGKGNNGTNIGGTILTIDRKGNTNSAYFFDGINDYINVNDANTLDFSNTFSISVWFQQKAANYDNMFDSYNGWILSKQSVGTNDGFMIDVFNSASQSNPLYCSSQSGRLRFVSRGITGTSTNFPECHLFNSWYHVCITYNNGTVKYYLNNVLAKSITSSSTNIFNNNYPLRIGYSSSGSRNIEYFNGSIDDIRLYNRVINENEVSALFHE